MTSLVQVNHSLWLKTPSRAKISPAQLNGSKARVGIILVCLGKLSGKGGVTSAFASFYSAVNLAWGVLSPYHTGLEIE